MKMGEQSVPNSTISGDEDEALETFKRMSLPKQRSYISNMESLKSGFMTPGMAIDDMIDRRIQQLDDKFKDINFG